ncbi:MAG: hypothetical protein ACFFDI_21390 [Promethearchaeota archaeon]
MSSIPKEIALELCEEVRTKNERKRFGVGKTQCYFCWRFGKEKYEAGDPSNLCALNHENNRGCWQVNKLYDKHYSN